MKHSRRSWLKNAGIASAGIVTTAPAFSTNRAFSKYHESEVNGQILLNSNENAYGPSQAVIEAINHSVKESNRYPWQTRQVLIDRISKNEGIPSDSIILGAGSTEILQLAGLAFGARGGKIVSSYPTFPLMMQHASTFDAQWMKVPLDKDFSHNLDGLLEACRDAQLVYFCNPNNPTGTKTDAAELLSFCKKVPSETMIFVDEAYIEFTADGISSSLASEVLSMPNLVVARTFSKIYGLAGLRVGYAYAHPEIIKQLKRYHIGFEINMPTTSLYAALAAADDQTFVEMCKKENSKAKDLIYEAFDSWGVSYIPSHTSFIYFETKNFQPELVATLDKHRISIREYDDQPGYARVSMGTIEQVRQFTSTIRQFRL
ncbi:MAG: histidinol-phosphate aminotransferase family protein [Saprospiraceae bacterium]|nr:histidinol-phosphate aminotransferase family protein [Saprospiraceae bacterium]